MQHWHWLSPAQARPAEQPARTDSRHGQTGSPGTRNLLQPHSRKRELLFLCHSPRDWYSWCQVCGLGRGRYEHRGD